ncbi:MAG: DUF2937 family protein [Opitutus sp.]
MNPGRKLLGAVEGLLDRVLCVVGAILFSQAPEFMQQYLQRLGGRLDEARLHVLQFQHTAAESGLTLERLISQTTANADPAVARLGGVMTAAIARVGTLEQAQTAILHASLWARPFVFLRNFDPAIARSTWSIFRPAVPTTLEGLVYALLGMLVLLAVYRLGLKYPATRLARARRAARAVPPVQAAQS